MSDKQISVNVIVSKTNPLHGKYAEIADGMQAYFDMVNSEGGLYRRRIVITKQRDDITGLQNREQVQQALASDNAFATFIATTQFFGADLLQAAGQPTFGWNINVEWGDKNALFGSSAALCAAKNCPGVTFRWLASRSKATRSACSPMAFKRRRRTARPAFARRSNGGRPPQWSSSTTRSSSRRPTCQDANSRQTRCSAGRPVRQLCRECISCS